MNPVLRTCLVAASILLPVGCGHSRREKADMWMTGHTEPLLPYEATSPEQQSEDLHWLRANPLFGDLYQ